MNPRARPLGLTAAVLLAALVLAAPPTLADTIAQIEHPTKVPAFESFLSLGNGIPPGDSGTYGFTLRNRYNASMENVTLEVEIYRWATAEAARPIGEISSPPVFSATGRLDQSFAIGTMAPNATFAVRLTVEAAPLTPEGVYFTRHMLEFDYNNVTDPFDPTPSSAHFVMRSRGHFTAEEFQSINYSDLENSLDALNVSGIVPDSSFSIRKPAPLWPLALVAGATAATGLLAFLSYVGDAYPERYPKVKRQMLRWSGKMRVWRAVASHMVRSRLGR